MGRVPNTANYQAPAVEEDARLALLRELANPDPGGAWGLLTRPVGGPTFEEEAGRPDEAILGERAECHRQSADALTALADLLPPGSFAHQALTGAVRGEAAAALGWHDAAVAARNRTAAQAGGC